MALQNMTLPFGTAADGADASLFVVSDDSGMTVAATDLGASLVSVKVPDAHGNLVDVTLGYGGAARYADNAICLGAVVGRCAGRIRGASFELGGTTHRLTANEHGNSLHSGPNFWHGRLWKAERTSEPGTLSFSLHSPAGDQGYPGSVDATVTYRLTETNELHVTFAARPSEPTIVNMTTHAYWNLNGHASGDVLDHVLCLDASSYLPCTEKLIPTGEVAPLTSELDYSSPATLGARALGPRLDTPFVLDAGDGGSCEHAARLVGDRSRIALDFSTTAPGLLVYSGYWLDASDAKDGAHYGANAGVALEPMFYPDAIHHPEFPSPVFSPERPYEQHHVLAFSIAE